MHGPCRFSVGAVNVVAAILSISIPKTHTIGPEHIMASAALPPAFPAVEIEGEQYWDGGLVSNTPLQWIIDSRPHRDTLAFQVDLWNARGEPPRTIARYRPGKKEIQYSSRTRAGTDNFKYGPAAAGGPWQICSRSSPRICRTAPRRSCFSRW